MTNQTQELISRALQLPLEERAVIIDALLTSEPLADVDHGPAESSDEVQAAWKKEIERRITDSDSGRTESIPLEEAWPRMAGKHA